MKVVGLSGAQGGGKSSLILELKKRGCLVDDFRVSRAVQAQLGWESLDRVMDSPETMMKFQNEVLRQKYNRDLTLSVKSPAEYCGQREQNKGDPRGMTLTPKPDDWRNEIILTERTFADIWAYTSQWTYRFLDRHLLEFNEAMAYATQFAGECTRSQNLIYSGIVLLPYMDHVQWQADPNRASRDDVNSVYEDIEKFVMNKMPIDKPRIIISRQTIEDRADQVETFLKTL